LLGGRIVSRKTHCARGSTCKKQRVAQSVFEGTGDGLFIKDLQGHCIIANQTFATLCGTTVDQAIGKSTLELIDWQSARALMELDAKVFHPASANSSNTS
jgi:PAS domain S-box-containing protein